MVARFDTIALSQEGPDRVRVSGVRGEPAPVRTKVCINHAGGYKNALTMLISEPDVTAKAELAEESFWGYVGGREQFEETRTTFRRGAAEDDEGLALLSIAARDADEKKVGRKFWNAGMEMALSNYPGFQLANSSRAASAITVYWPALISSACIDERVFIHNETIAVAPPPQVTAFDAVATPERSASDPVREPLGGEIRNIPLGRIVGARSGDKGGNANVGFWARTSEVYHWMVDYLTPARIRELYPEARDLRVERYELANLLSINFVIHGLLGEGVSASLRTDPQAKMLCEELRATRVPVPQSVLDKSGFPSPTY